MWIGNCETVLGDYDFKFSISGRVFEIGVLVIGLYDI